VRNSLVPHLRQHSTFLSQCGVATHLVLRPIALQTLDAFPLLGLDVVRSLEEGQHCTSNVGKNPHDKMQRPEVEGMGY